MITVGSAGCEIKIRNQDKLVRRELNPQKIVGLDKLLSEPLQAAFEHLNTSESGLSSENAEALIEIYGYNELARKKRRLALIEFLSHFKNPLLLILLVAGAISIFFGEVVNAAIIFTIIGLSVILDFYQESKAERAAETLKQKVTTTATAIRDGSKKEVKITDIVPGDIIYLSAGDMVPADARVINAKDFFVNQSALTGESLPVEKKPENQAKSRDITEWSNAIFLGTSVVSGTATALILKTGSYTVYGKIVSKIVARSLETDYQRGLRRFGFLILQVTFMLVIFVFFINALYRHNVLDALLFAVALSVGLTPDLLPMILSVNLSKGAIEMSKRGVIVKRLSSIQNFGSMDILCTDKTGTLTENKIALVKHIDVDGNEDEKVLLYSFLNSYHQTGLKSPLDEAILKHRELDISGYKKIDEVPFDFNRKRVSIVVEDRGNRILISKGAPEEVAKVCEFYEDNGEVKNLTERPLKLIKERYRQLSSEGFRVLSVSYTEVQTDKTLYTVEDEKQMVFLGFVAFIDPPKETAKESLKLLEESGIQLKILTGDNELVTRKVCEYLDFEIQGIVLGDKISDASSEALARIVEENNIFCRVTPGQKDRIICALKNNGHVVGFLGDGINDAPSMKTADVSVSVDNAVDVAKESADIILLEKRLRVLEEGVVEGRKTFANTLKYIVMGTSSNFGNMFSVAAGSIFLPFLPMLPGQILLNNLLYDLSELTIPTDKVDKEAIQRPRRWDISYIKRAMLFFGPISSIFDFLTYFIMLFVFSASAPLFQTAWFTESLVTQIMVIYVIRTAKPFYRSPPSKPLVYGGLSAITAALIIPYTPIGILFGFTAPPLAFYIILLGIVALYMVMVEIAKKRFYRKILKAE